MGRRCQSNLNQFLSISRAQELSKWYHMRVRALLSPHKKAVFWGSGVFTFFFLNFYFLVLNSCMCAWGGETGICLWMPLELKLPPASPELPEVCWAPSLSSVKAFAVFMLESLIHLLVRWLHLGQFCTLVLENLFILFLVIWESRI